MSEGENFKGGVASTAKEDADRGQEREHIFEHELTVVTWRNVASYATPPQVPVADSKTSRAFGHTQRPRCGPAGAGYGEWRLSSEELRASNIERSYGQS